MSTFQRSYEYVKEEFSNKALFFCKDIRIKRSNFLHTVVESKNYLDLSRTSMSMFPNTLFYLYLLIPLKVTKVHNDIHVVCLR